MKKNVTDISLVIESVVTCRRLTSQIKPLKLNYIACTEIHQEEPAVNISHFLGSRLTDDVIRSEDISSQNYNKGD